MASLLFCALSELSSFGGDIESDEDREFIWNIVAFINNHFSAEEKIEFSKEKLIEYIRNKDESS